VYIKKVELENIKSHEKAVFDFERGSTAITGENGAGKTTIIEAIAWALFDTLDYKKDDFVRRGAKRGRARVTFESSADERDYVVHRDTGAGFYVFDPVLGTRVVEKKEEVMRFLWQHLGVEPGTDLESLFKQAIGVPQGTFTAVFLATPAERKATFDALLKVEEYRRSAEELLKTTRYLDMRISDVNVNIARAQGEIARIEAVENEHRNFQEQAAELSSKVEELRSCVTRKLEEVKALDQAESMLASLLADLEKCRNERSRAELVLVQRETELKQAQKAAETIETVKADHDRHIEALDRQKELERERGEREKLRIGCTKVESAISAVLADRKHLTRDLESIQRSHTAIESLKQLVHDQERLERDVERLRADVNKLDAACTKLKSLDEQLQRLRESYRANSEQLTEARTKGIGAERMTELENRDSELLRELASLQAALERDERFQTEIQNGLCPILSEKCLNLKEGQTLEMFVTSQFGELKTKISLLENEKVNITTALTTSREAAKYLAQITVLEARAAEIGNEGTLLKNERAELQKVADGMSTAKEELERIENELKALDNPRSKISILENEARREGDILEQLSAIEKNLERLESERRINAEQLEAYKDLDQHLAETNDVRDKTTDAYRMFLANESLAKTIAERHARFDESKRELDAAIARLSQSEAVYTEAGKGYDRDRHLSERASLVELQRRHAETNATYEAAKKREAELSAELDQLISVRNSMQHEFREKERLEKVAEVTDFIRVTLREAAPLVARNYVYHVSVEANQLFREISGSAECTLKWTEDYGIVMEEDGFERPFQSLSGGEQMAAALSVRLALLKQLSDIRIAFFDEPTTNMDRERRENLAQQIGQIRHFEQLFVISHDDTFDGYMDHELKIV
jgi:DNA repair protein SbcC/Rad50